MENQFKLNAEKFDNLESFYQQIYSLMTLYQDWKPAQNLDALNDMLYSGFGKNAVLVWMNSEKSKIDFGLEATIEFYQNKINQGHPFNIEWAQEKLDELEVGSGQTLFDILVEIFSEHPKINLILK